MNGGDRDQLLAGEYVLGVLRGGARARLEARLRDEPALARAVAQWEARLAPLLLNLPEQEPPAAVWRQVEQRIAPKPHLAPEDDAAGWWNSLLFWRGASFSLLLAAVFLLLPLLRPAAPPPAPVTAAAPVQRFVAVVNDARGQPLWLLACYKGPDQVRIQPVRAPAAPGGKDYELWLVSGDGGPAPVSLGVLGSRNRTVYLPPEQAQIMWKQAQAFAVSEEPQGGSPTGQPTGPVRHVAPMVPSI